MLGSPATTLATMRPVTPSIGIRTMPRGRPMATVTMLCIMTILVSPKPYRKPLMLRLPKTANRLPMTYIARKKGAETYFSPYSVPTIGPDRAIRTIVAGTTSMDVYLIEDAKTFFTSSCSFWGSSFANAGNSTVDIGMVMKVRRTVKLIATT